MLRRIDKGLVATWWWTIDRWFLSAFLVLMGLGVILSFAASPAVAERIGLDTFHFAKNQIIYMIPALLALIGVSFLTPRQVRRLALVMLVVMLVMLVAVLIFGQEAKGAKRWISVAGFSLQPSEFMKPAFVVMCAWLFAEQKNKKLPGTMMSLGLLGLVLSLLVLQPDLGQTMLTLATWGVMFFLAGMSWFWIVLFGGIGIVAGGLAYVSFDHVQSRINRFLSGEGDMYQVMMGQHALVNGGFTGVGPGEGIYKKSIPDSHADFVFSVAGEEYGLIMCMLIAGLFAFVVLRGMMFALREHDEFTRLSVAGLVTVFGLQAFINMGVNLQILPAKGMTLPFISYGGSSLIAIAISMGMVLALTRSSPQRLKNIKLTAMPRGALAAAE